MGARPPRRGPSRVIRRAIWTFWSSSISPKPAGDRIGLIRAGPVPAAASAGDAGFAEVAEHARVNETRPRRRGQGVRAGRLLRLRQAPGEGGLTPVERPRQPIRHVIGEVRPREDKAP